MSGHTNKRAKAHNPRVKYWPHYNLNERTTPEQYDALTYWHRNEWVTYRQCLAVCKRYNVSATLRNEQGWTVGYCHANGDWS